MKVKLNINSNLNEEKAEFWIKKMTTKIEQITKELNSKQDFLWCYQDRDAFQVKYNDIFLIQVENEKTQIYTQSDKYIFKERLYQIELRRIYPAILLWLPEAPLLIIVN